MVYLQQVQPPAQQQPQSVAHWPDLQVPSWHVQFLQHPQQPLRAVVSVRTSEAEVVPTVPMAKRAIAVTIILVSMFVSVSKRS